MGAVVPRFERRSLSSSRKSEIFERPRSGVADVANGPKNPRHSSRLTRFTPDLKAGILSLNQDRHGGSPWPYRLDCTPICRIPDTARTAVSGADMTKFGVRGAPLVLIAGNEEGYAAPWVEAVEPG